jgi:transcription antitermination factor NusG
MHVALDINPRAFLSPPRGFAVAAGQAGAQAPASGAPGKAPELADDAHGSSMAKHARASWICVQHRADDGARVRIALRRKGFTVHWPRVVIRIPRRDDVLRPLFPGYLFARPDACPWQTALEARNVIRVLGVRETGAPRLVPDSYVAELIDMAGGIDGVIPAREDLVASWRPGVTMLRITSGPWQGLSGLLWSDRGRDRVQVLLHVLGVERPVSVPRTAVREA